MLGLGDFIANPSYRIPKKPKENTITMGKIKKKAKKMTNISQKVNKNMNNAQERQFRTMVRNSLLLFFLCLCYFFPSVMICNVEFNSNSLCLDRLDNLGINSLQKLQN